MVLLLTEGQASDHRGAALMLHKLPHARELIGDRGYDSGRFRAELAARGIAPRIPSTRSRKVPIPHDATLYRQRHRGLEPAMTGDQHAGLVHQQRIGEAEFDRIPGAT